MDVGAIKIRDIFVTMQRLLMSIANPPWVDKSALRVRETAIIESGTVTTVTTVTGMSNIDSMQGRILIYGQNMSAWSQCVRQRIS